LRETKITAKRNKLTTENNSRMIKWQFVLSFSLASFTGGLLKLRKFHFNVYFLLFFSTLEEEVIRIAVQKGNKSTEMSRVGGEKNSKMKFLKDLSGVTNIISSRK
jgi:hypothetical protein